MVRNLEALGGGAASPRVSPRRRAPQTKYTGGPFSVPTWLPLGLRNFLSGNDAVIGGKSKTAQALRNSLRGAVEAPLRAAEHWLIYAAIGLAVLLLLLILVRR